MTIEQNVEQALKRANATDVTIQNYAEQEVINWVDNNFRTHRWDFMRKEGNTTISSGTDNISLPADYYKMNTVKLKNSNDQFILLRVTDRTQFDRIDNLSLQGVPYMCAVLGSSLYFYPVPDRQYGVYYSYWKTISTITKDTDVVTDMGYTDQIIQRVAFIAARQYDGLDFTSEYQLLQKDLADYRRNATDEGSDGTSIPLDQRTHRQRPINFY